MAKEIQRIKICPDCGVDNPAAYWRCWICSCDLRGQGEIILAAEVLDEPEAPPIANRPPTWTRPVRRSVMPVVWLVVLTTVVGIGLSLQEEWMLIPYVIAVIPVLLCLLLIEQARRSRRKAMTSLDTMYTVMLSVGMFLSIMLLVLVAVVIALFFVCLSILDPHR